MIWQLARACAGHPIMLLEVPHVSLRLQARASAVDDVAGAAAAALRAEGFAEASVLARSRDSWPAWCTPWCAAAPPRACSRVLL